MIFCTDVKDSEEDGNNTQFSALMESNLKINYVFAS